MRAPEYVLVLAALVPVTAACGDEDPPPPVTTRQAQPRAPTPAKPGPGTTPAVVAYRRVEDRTADPDEQKALRHQFSERDFAPDLTGTENRDPFRSFVVSQPGVGIAAGPAGEATELCPRKRQFARSFSARELKLVGIVSRGTIRYALFSDPGQYGYVIHAGDCVGKEKARVKEIGASFVTLEISAETPPNQPPRQAEQRSIQLHPKDLPVGASDEDEVTDDRGVPADLRRRSDELLRGGEPPAASPEPAAGGQPAAPPSPPSPPSPP